MRYWRARSAATQITPCSRQLGDLVGAQAEDRAVDVVVVLAEQRRRAPVVGCELRGRERHALEPGLADHRMVELEEHVAVGDLRVVLVDVLGVLHRAGAHAGGLQEVHQLVTVARRRSTRRCRASRSSWLATRPSCVAKRASPAHCG